MSIADRIAAVTRERPKKTAMKAEINEKRWAQRKSGMTAGLVVFHPGKPPVDCVIRDMSATGARLEIAPNWSDGINSAADVPDAITLLVRQDRIEVDCDVVWRKTQQFGVRFKGGLRPLTRKIASPHAKAKVETSVTD